MTPAIAIQVTEYNTVYYVTKRQLESLHKDRFIAWNINPKSYGWIALQPWYDAMKGGN